MPGTNPVDRDTQVIPPSNPGRQGEKLHTPVLFITFNRPDFTQKVFNEIRKAQPTQLFIAVDGPREDRPDDIERCRKVLEITRKVDWDCKVSTLVQEKNLGCKIGESTAIDWFFSQVEEGIILEDDTVPDQSFFLFCQELLEKYRHDQRIMMISGDNFQFGRRRTEDSYYFSKYFITWGWASWRRAWNCYDITMEKWPLVRDGHWLNDILNDFFAVKYWERIFEDTYNGTIDTWDYQWILSCWIHGGLSITPNTNLISNIGYNKFATHTTNKNDPRSDLPVYQMMFPLKHPGFIIHDELSDRASQKIAYPDASLFGKERYILLCILGRIRKI
jgi:hypothetical protein